VAIVESIQLKRVQFEVLSGNPPQPQATCEMRAHVRGEGEGRASLLLTARFFESHPNPPYRLELALEGVFRLEEGETPDSLARGPGPSVLFPYLKHEVALLTVRAGLPPMVLPPLRLAAPASVREGLN